MRDLDLQTLRLFAAVCEQRSIARVAEQESIVGSAISKRLAQLEDTVGPPLLPRKGRGVVPTPAGETPREHPRPRGSAPRRNGLGASGRGACPGPCGPGIARGPESLAACPFRPGRDGPPGGGARARRPVRAF